jgi:hypothetical protein
MRNKRIGLIGALAIGAAVIVPSRGGAQEMTENPQAKLAGASKDIRVETIATRDELKAAVDALDALTRQKSGDLRPSYDAFVAEVKKTHAAAEQTLSRAGSMESASKDYFSAWQAEVGGIGNESLRRNAQRRLDDVRKSYDKVVASLRRASVAFKPFLSDLDDIQKTLANDVTEGGVKAIRGVANDAKNNQRKVLRYVNEAIDQLGDMEKRLSSQKGS